MIEFSGNARIHLDSFLSVFNIAGLPENYYYNGMVNENFLTFTSFIEGKKTLLVMQRSAEQTDKIMIAGRLSNEEDTFVDGAVIAAARSLPSWSDGDIPPSPSRERKAVKELQEECRQMLAAFPTTTEKDQKMLGTPCSPCLLPKLTASLAYRITGEWPKTQSDF